MTRPSTPRSSSPRRLAIAVRGVIQGVGFRPFVYRAAREHGLSGWVLNEADTVRIEVEGDASALDAFVATLRRGHPPQARIDALDIQEMPLQHSDPSAFQIRTSTGASPPRPTIPADLATCPECLAEIRDPSARRHNYPFTNCTNCGPRWSIIEQLPYDRPRTSMAGFTMCPACRAEYDDPGDRRFHAQPIACPRCGPTLQLLDCQGHETAAGEAALSPAAEALLSGRVVAIKGLGGFQLLVDATNPAAVALLRGRKRRPDRPFALMLPSLDAVRTHCHVSAEEARMLTSHQAPIVLLRRHSPLSTLPSPLSIVASVAPGNPYLGIMLPYTPLHHLLMAAVARPVVCTSGNLSEEPMAIAIEDALIRLGPIADVMLTHDRPIVRPVDDSIVRVGPEGVEVVRRARGFAPLPIELPVDGQDVPTILAVGGHLKNTVALLLGSMCETHGRVRETYQAQISVRSTHPAQVVLSAHIGDLDSVLSVDVFRRAIDDLVEFFQAQPAAIVCDLHPDYASTRHAETLSLRWDVPLLRVQHHHAHVAACMAEHGLPGPVLGFSWDGTGYGPDGTIWGGEALWCEGGEFRRAAVRGRPGRRRAGQTSAGPPRSALGALFEIFGESAAGHALSWFTAGELATLLSMLRGQVNSPRTSSMGRLFDAVAAVCGLSPVITFEGQAAMALEFAADESEQGAYPITVSSCGAAATAGQVANLPHEIANLPDKPVIADWEPLIRAVLADRAAGVPAGRISARFHNALADMALAIARHAVAPSGRPSPIVLTGGCFQNALLTARVRSRLSAAGFQVYTHQKVPPGDGGMALGQILLGLRRFVGPSRI